MTSRPVPALPAIHNLGISPPGGVDPVEIAKEWLEKFQTAISPSPSGDIDIVKILELFQPDAFWRDILSLTWDFRTFFGVDQIKTFLLDRIANLHLGDKTRLHSLKLGPLACKNPGKTSNGLKPCLPSPSGRGEPEMVCSDLFILRTAIGRRTPFTPTSNPSTTTLRRSELYAILFQTTANGRSRDRKKSNLKVSIHTLSLLGLVRAGWTLVPG